MTAQRQYEPFTLFSIRIVDMRHLWSPSDTYKGQKQQKPNYFAGFIIPKTQAQWSQEPQLQDLMRAYGKLYQNNPQVQDWRIEDGDTPNAEGKSSEFAKGHWLFNASTSNAPNVELVQAGGSLVKLTNKVGVKSGDYCMIGGTAAISGQNNRAIKLYLNSVVFSAPGEEIVFANSVSGAELMQQAQRQGLQVAGFSGAPGGFSGGGQPFGAPQGGGQPFGAPQGQPQPFPGQGAPPFGQTNGQPQGFAPPASGAPAAAQGHTPFGGVSSAGTTFPSNGAPAFGAPPAGPFGAPPAGPFGQR